MEEIMGKRVEMQKRKIVDKWLKMEERDGKGEEIRERER